MDLNNYTTSLIRELNSDGKLPSGVHSCQTKRLLDLLKDENNRSRILCFLIYARTEMFKKLYRNDFIDLNDIIKCVELQPASLRFLPREIINNEDFIKLVIEIVQPDWYDLLPTFISEIPEIQKKCNRTSKVYMENGLDKDGYNFDWVNENGELIYFFKLKGNFPIKSKEDYYKLYDEYIESRMSVTSFCKKYEIDSEEGFNLFLNRVEAESFEDFSMIKDVKTDVQHRFYSSSRKDVKKILSGELSIDEFVSNNQVNFQTAKVDLYFSFLSFEEKNKFARILMDYFEENLYAVNENFLQFLTTSNANPIENYGRFIRPNLKMPNDSQYIRNYHKQIEKLKSHARRYTRKELYSTYIVGEKRLSVDDDVIDQAYAYSVDKNYRRSYTCMCYLCKKILYGELDYKKETVLQRDEMIDGIIALIAEEKTIEDYINLMKNKRTLK